MKACKKIASLVLTLCLVAGILPTAAFAANEGTLLALGDSISAGYDVAVEERFTNLVAKHYGLTEVNRAVNGSTATDLKALLNTGDLDDEIASASLITLTVGGNEMVDILCTRIANIYNSKPQNTTKITADDVIPTLESLSGIKRLTWAGSYVVPALAGSSSSGLPKFSETNEFKAGLATYEQDLTASLKYIRERNSTAQVVVCTQFAPFKQFQTHKVFGNAYKEVNIAAEKLNNVIRKYPSSLNYVVADIHPIFDQTKENLFPGDGSDDISKLSLTNVHPNARGHEVIAKVVTDLNLTITIPEPPLPFEPGVPAIHVSEKNVSLTDGTVKVNLNAMDGTMPVAAAFYNGAKMVGIGYAVPAANATEVTLTADLRGEATSVQVFLMGGSFAPVVTPVTFPAA